MDSAETAPIRRKLPTTIDRVPFVLWGVSLFVVKYALDLSIAHNLFARTWTPWDYLVTSVPVSALVNLSSDATFHLTLLGVAVPFIFVGVLLTVARLRAIGWSPWLAILFFLPVVNLMFFLVLAVTPSLPLARRVVPALPLSEVFAAVDLPDFADGDDTVVSYGHEASLTGFRRWLPEGKGASLLIASLLPVPFGMLLTYVAVHLFRDYGWGVFVALPFAQGVLASAIHGARRYRSVGQCLSAALLCGVFTTVATFSLAVEGLGCLVMLLPLAIPIMLIGGVVGFSLQAGARPPRVAGAPAVRFWSLVPLALAVPAFMTAEHAAKPTAPLYAVTTSLDVDAPPAAVWQHVISFGRIPPPGASDWIFRAGVAYPVDATIDGHGEGAVRRCVFSTGAFIEPITMWDEPRLLKFDVTSNPPAMREWTPYAHINTPHVNDFLVSHGGQFHLIPLDGGKRTRLEGTTWYEHNLWPAGYWRVWSDAIIHRIHGRVLRHVKSLTEADVVAK
jgi:hypothetical protein